MSRVVITADGSCLKNPGGAGGYGVLLEYKGHTKEISGGEPATTNNRMELMGVITALESLKRPCPVLIRVDSQYVMKGMTEWMPAWKKRDFAAVKNRDLWSRLLEAAAPHDLEWEWVKGHAGDERNERADKLAYSAAKSFE